MTIQPNVAFECNSLHLLERLDDEIADLVYLDPPWSYSSGTYNSDEEFLGYLFRVIQQSFRCLKNTGNLFFYSNPDLNADFHVLLKKIFDPRNFITEFIIPRKNLFRAPSRLGTMHDTVILYTKTNNYDLNFRIKKVHENALIKLFPFEDDNGYYRTSSLFIQGDRPSQFFKWRGIEPPLGSHWKSSKEKMDELFEKKIIGMHTGSASYIQKHYLTPEDHYTQIGTIWDDIKLIKRPSDTLGVQSEELLGRIIDIGSNSGNLILDPFSGSGTSVIVSLLNNRKVIACDNSPVATVVLQNRLNEAQLENRISLKSTNDIIKFPIINNRYKTLYPTEDDNLIELILKGESGTLEFKESACWNYFLNKPDQSLVENILRTMAAFFNSSGGTLLIGVRNDSTLIDLNADYAIADNGKKNKDGYELFLNNKIRTVLGTEVLGNYKITFHSLNDCEICKIEIYASKVPVFLSSHFFVRNNNQSIKLSAQEFYAFIKSRENLG